MMRETLLITLWDHLWINKYSAYCVNVAINVASMIGIIKKGMD